MNFRFDRIVGPFHSSEKNFEQMMCQLLALSQGASPIDGAGGDEGMDCYAIDREQNLTVFQCKYYTERITQSRRNQIWKSFERVTTKHQVKKWVLCIPLDPTPGEERWFQTLAQPKLEIEWFGATKIRTLLATYPKVAHQFFEEEILLREFQDLRNWFSTVINALEPTIWARGRRSKSQSSPILYLQRAEQLATMLSEDLPLIEIPHKCLVAVDFHDIYLYLTCETNQFAPGAVVDYFFARAQWPLQLLPGAVAELHGFMDSFAKRGEYLVSRKGQMDQATTLDQFAMAYESDPDSEETRKAFEACVHESNVESYGISLRLYQLQELIESGRLQNADVPSDLLAAAKEQLQPMLDIFRRLRPERALANYADAWNLAVLAKLWSSGQVNTRMISSAASFQSAAKAAFHGPPPVRSCCDMNYLVHMKAEGLKESQPAGLAKRLQILRQTSVELASKLSLSDDVTALPDLPGAIKTLLKFEPNYRLFLRPIDEVIVNASRVPPRSKFVGMQELYECITQQATIIAGFRLWWDRVFGVLATLDELLHGANALKELTDLLPKPDEIVKRSDN